MRHVPLIRLVAVYYGFGPFGKALHLARAIRTELGEQVRLQIEATPSQAELLEVGLVDEVVSAPTVDADLVICIMNRVAARQAGRRGERLVFVDSLAWLWDEPIPVQDVVDIYCYQNLPAWPVPERNLVGFRRVVPIGPVVSEWPEPAKPRDHRSLVVSVAGLENFETSMERGNLWYAAMFMQTLRNELRSELSERWNIQVFGNSRVLRSVGRAPDWIMADDISQRSFSHACAGAGAVVASPGLTTLLEVAPSGVPMAFLPPQNYSQLIISRVLAEAGVAAAEWCSDVLDWMATHRVPEVVGSQSVRNAIANEWASSGAGPFSLSRSVEQARPFSADALQRLIGEGNGAIDVLSLLKEMLL